MATQDPDLADVLDAALENRLERFWTSLPGAVTSYDASTQTCSAQPQTRQGHYGEDGERAVERLPVINSVPVLFIGGGGYRVTAPVKSGDFCLLIMTSAALDKWQAHGDEVDPGDDLSRNTLGHAIAVVGLRPPSDPWQSAPADFMTIGKDDGPAIELDSTEIRVGGGVGHQPTLLATSFLGALNALLLALDGVAGAWAIDSSVSAPFVATTTAMAALVTAIATFVGAASTAISLIAKVK